MILTNSLDVQKLKNGTRLHKNFPLSKVCRHRKYKLTNIYLSTKEFIDTHIHDWLECSPMARETWVQSLVEAYQRLKKWYLMPPCLTLSIIRYESRVKRNNPGKGVAPSLPLWCSSYRKGSFRVTLDYGRQLYFYFTYNQICTLYPRQRHLQKGIGNYIKLMRLQFGRSA